MIITAKHPRIKIDWYIPISVDAYFMTASLKTKPIIERHIYIAPRIFSLCCINGHP
jgi:hypothetical protein